MIASLLAVEFLCPLLAAGGRRADQIGRAFQDNEAMTTPALLIGFTLLVGLAGLLWLAMWIRKWRHERSFNDPELLFTELCRAHSLTRSQRGVLELIAKNKQVANAAEIFLRRDALASQEGDAPAPQAVLRELDEILFGGEPD